jgi:aryl sulfotransferase
VQATRPPERQYRTAVFDTRRWEGFEHRPGDIFVCTPPKCGTTWMQTIVTSLLWPDGDAPAPVTVLCPWIEAEFIPADRMHAMLAAQTHRRAMKSHTPADGIPWFDTARYVVVGRDGRDAFMSMCNHVERFRHDVREELNARAAADGVPLMPGWTGDVHAFFQIWLGLPLVFDHIASFWKLRQEPNLLFVHYGDLKADLEGEMRRVADFLDIDVREERWKGVAGRCTFEAMRTRGAEIGPFERIFDGGSDAFLFKGTNGRWRDVLTREELAAYDRVVAEKLPPDAAAWLSGGRHALSR